MAADAETAPQVAAAAAAATIAGAAPDLAAAARIGGAAPDLAAAAVAAAKLLRACLKPGLAPDQRSAIVLAQC